MAAVRKDKHLIKPGMLLMYQNPNIGVEEILRHYGVARNTLISWAREEGIPIRHKHPPNKESKNANRAKCNLSIDREVLQAFKEECYLIKKFPADVMEWLMRSWVMCQIEDRAKKQ